MAKKEEEEDEEDEEESEEDAGDCRGSEHTCGWDIRAKTEGFAKDRYACRIIGRSNGNHNPYNMRRGVFCISRMAAVGVCT